MQDAWIIFWKFPYIKDKVHQTLNLNINLPKDGLIAAAKVSVGTDQTYWMDIVHKGATQIFDLNKELLPFVHDPETYAGEKYDAHKQRLDELSAPYSDNVAYHAFLEMERMAAGLGQTKKQGEE